jgi:hypothetical protein
MSTGISGGGPESPIHRVRHRHSVAYHLDDIGWRDVALLNQTDGRGSLAGAA